MNMEVRGRDGFPFELELEELRWCMESSRGDGSTPCKDRGVFSRDAVRFPGAGTGGARSRRLERAGPAFVADPWNLSLIHI